MASLTSTHLGTVVTIQKSTLEVAAAGTYRSSRAILLQLRLLKVSRQAVFLSDVRILSELIFSTAALTCANWPLKDFAQKLK